MGLLIRWHFRHSWKWCVGPPLFGCMYFQIHTHTRTQWINKTLQTTNQLITNSSCLAKGKDNREAGRRESTAVLIQQQSLTFETNISAIRALYWTIFNTVAVWPYLWIDPDFSPWFFHCSIVRRYFFLATNESLVYLCVCVRVPQNLRYHLLRLTTVLSHCPCPCSSLPGCNCLSSFLLVPSFLLICRFSLLLDCHLLLLEI